MQRIYAQRILWASLLLLLVMAILFALLQSAPPSP